MQYTGDAIMTSAPLWTSSARMLLSSKLPACEGALPAWERTRASWPGPPLGQAPSLDRTSASLKLMPHWISRRDERAPARTWRDPGRDGDRGGIPPQNASTSMQSVTRFRASASLVTLTG
jgi:hypothetical protein